jgi:hypothetical protein
MTNATGNTNDQRLRAHPMYTPSDLRYLRGKGYSDEQIIAFWERDRAQGKGPTRHRPRPGSLMDRFRDELSPGAVAAVVAGLQATTTGDPRVNRELDALQEQLVELLGGEAEKVRLWGDLGL